MMRALEAEVQDAVWEAVRALLPAVPDPADHPLGCHRGRVGDEVCFQGILIRLISGASWETIEWLLGRVVSDTTLGARRDEWIAAGVFERLEAEAVAAYDRIIEFDGASVANLEEYAALLFAARPGDTVEVIVLRGDQHVATAATLGKRR